MTDGMIIGLILFCGGLAIVALILAVRKTKPKHRPSDAEPMTPMHNLLESQYVPTPPGLRLIPARRFAHGPVGPVVVQEPSDSGLLTGVALGMMLESSNQSQYQPVDNTPAFSGFGGGESGGAGASGSWDSPSDNSSSSSDSSSSYDSGSSPDSSSCCDSSSSCDSGSSSSSDF